MTLVRTCLSVLLQSRVDALADFMQHAVATSQRLPVLTHRYQQHTNTLAVIGNNAMLLQDLHLCIAAKPTGLFIRLLLQCPGHVSPADMARDLCACTKGLASGTPWSD